jgi:6-phosphogluconate dehydrogenase
VVLHVFVRCLQGGCIIRAGFLDRIKQAYQRDPSLPSLLVDPPFAKVRTALASVTITEAQQEGTGIHHNYVSQA